ncbi:MAG: carbamoylphosphate synthase large subunit [Deltaproteobacteria bacterium GWB2_55_19]|nr:MAG: carbamoylphosphate synthase large subunit [Deltaproteobacteria bacterium GWB2_55_19]
MATSKEAVRIFKYGSLELQDPDPSMTPEQVREFYSSVYPELTQSVIEGPEYGEDSIKYEFSRSVGTKG